MGRKSFAVQEVEQLKEMVRHTLNLCDVCEGCDLMRSIKEIEGKAWQEHRQGIQYIVHRCNSFKRDPRKRKIAPKIEV